MSSQVIPVFVGVAFYDVVEEGVLVTVVVVRTGRKEEGLMAMAMVVEQQQRDNANS